MRLQRLTAQDFTVLENPGVRSEQIIWPRNAPDAAVTDSGDDAARRHHAPALASQFRQVWIVEQGAATLLLADDETAPVQAGDVIRTPPGEVHGLTNTGKEPFVYLTATTPPIDLTTSYQGS